MKKFTILFLALSMAFAASAVPVKTAKYALANAGVKKERTVNAKMLATQQAKADKAALVAQYKDKALTLKPAKMLKKAANLPSVQKAPAAKNAQDTVQIVGLQFNYQYYAETGDWWIGISNNVDYNVYLDYISASFTGTFVTDDFDLSYSYIEDYTSGTKTYVDYTAVKMTVTDDETGVNVYAVIDGSDGKVYVVTAHEDPLPEPKKTVVLNYTKGTFVGGESSFQLYAQDKFGTVSEDSIYTSLLFYYDEGNVAGTYTMDDAVQYGVMIGYFGTDTTLIDPLDINATIVENTEDSLYVCNAELLGTDTVLYKITLSAAMPAPIVPKDTVDVTVTNLEVVDFIEYLGAVFITGDNAEYDVSLIVDAEELYGTFGKSSLSNTTITNKTTGEEISVLDGEIEIANWFGANFVSGEILGSDTILYKLDMSYVAPDAKDTVNIVFAAPGESELNEEIGDYYMYNEDDKYIVQLDVYTSQAEGTYYMTDFDSYYTYIGIINNGDTTGLNMLDAMATVTKVNDNLYSVYAEVLGSDTILYKITSQFTYTFVAASTGLKYDTEEGDVNRTYTPADNITVTDYVADYGVVLLNMKAADNSDVVSLQFYVDEADADIIPVGTYTIDGSYAAGSVLASEGVDDEGYVTNSYYGIYASEGGLSDVWFLVGGTVEVEKIGGKMKVTVDAVNSYDVPVHIVYDATETAVETVAADAAKATKKLGADGQLYILHNGKTFTATGVVVE